MTAQHPPQDADAQKPTSESTKARTDDSDTDIGADLEPDEAADLLRSQQDAAQMEEEQRDDLQDEDLISLDGSD